MSMDYRDQNENSQLSLFEAQLDPAIFDGKDGAKHLPLIH